MGSIPLTTTIISVLGKGLEFRWVNQHWWLTKFSGQCQTQERTRKSKKKKRRSFNRVLDTYLTQRMGTRNIEWIWKKKKNSRSSKLTGQRIMLGYPKGMFLCLWYRRGKWIDLMIHTEFFKRPSILVALEMAEEEFWYGQPGILKVPCDVEYFQRLMDLISSSKAKWYTLEKKK